LNSYLNILSDNDFTTFIRSSKIVAVYRRSNNIRRILVKSDISSDKFSNGSYPCRQNCLTCKFMSNTIEFKSTATNETFKIFGHHTCKTVSLIYLITCKQCKLQYVGQTGNSLRDRFYGHLADIRSKNNVKPVSRHFNINGHREFDVTIIQTTERNINIRLRTEEVWIRKLKTRTPSGLNLM
jgi:hypothetical protein